MGTNTMPSGSVKDGVVFLGVNEKEPKRSRGTGAPLVSYQSTYKEYSTNWYMRDCWNGRQATLRSLYPDGCVGSSPTSRTI